MSTDAAVEQLASVSDADVEVRIVRVRTGNGTRIRLESGDASIALDAIALESLTWQDGSQSAAPEDDAVRQRVRVSNEYTAVDVVVPNHEAWIGLVSRRLGYERRLTPATLAEIARLDMADISGYLSTPFGPQA